MVNNRVNYSKQSFRPCQHNHVIHLNDGKKTSNLNDSVDHGKQSFRSCMLKLYLNYLDILEYEEDELASQNLAKNSEDEIGDLNR